MSNPAKTKNRSKNWKTGVSGLKSLISDQKGALAVLVAISAPVFIGGLGLGGEVSYWYFTQRKLQNASDVSAYAAAISIAAGRDETARDAAALLAAKNGGFDEPIGDIIINEPPTSGAFAGDPRAVEVTLRESVPRMLTSIFENGDVPISGRAVAKYEQPMNGCILALHPTAAEAVRFMGGGTSNLVDCSVHANSVSQSAVFLNGSSQVNTPCASTPGTVDATTGLNMDVCRKPIDYSDTVDDPYEGLAEPILPASCAAVNSFAGPPGSTYTIDASERFCGGLDLKRDITMLPGVYVIDGGTLTINSTAMVQGDDVTFFLTNGANIQINGGANVDLSAPTTGTYAGVLFFVDPDNGYDVHQLNGGANMIIQGTVYAPEGHVDFAGNADLASAGCSQIIGRTIQISGDSAFGNNCTGTGVAFIRTNPIVRIVE